MRNSHSTFWWIIALIVVAAGAYWYGHSRTVTNNTMTPRSENSESVPSHTAIPATSDAEEKKPFDTITLQENGETLYTNNQYNFTLTFPKNWKELRVEQKATDTGSPYLIFELPKKDSSYGDVFHIAFYTLDQWHALQAEGSPMPSRLAGKADLVFAYALAQDDTGFAGYPDPVPGLTYKGPIFEAEEIIIPSFSLK